MTTTPELRDWTVVGAGAIGGSLAHHLALKGHRVTVVDADHEHVAAICAIGLTVRDHLGLGSTVSVDAMTPGSAEASGLVADRVLLATKRQHVSDAASWLDGHVRPGGVVHLCQNGLSYLLAATHLDPALLVPVFVDFAADRLEPGVIRAGGSGELVFGELSGERTPRVREAVTDLAGFGAVRSTDNILGHLWAKRALGAVISATALVDADISTVVDSHRAELTGLAAEVVNVALAEGIRLEPIDGIDLAAFAGHQGEAARDSAVDATVGFLASMPGKTRSGVFRDIVVRRVPSEASGELAEIARTGERHGIPCRAVRLLHEQLRGLERGDQQPSPILLTALNPTERTERR